MMSRGGGWVSCLVSFTKECSLGRYLVPDITRCVCMCVCERCEEMEEEEDGAANPCFRYLYLNININIT